MTIIEALKTEPIRVSNGDRWLYFDETTEEWVVNEHRYGKRKVTCLIRTTVESDAVDVLIS